MNEKPFEYTSYHGTHFKCERSDFREKVYVTSPSELPQSKLLTEVAEMTGHHAKNIHPQLNGFQGYDCIQFEIIS